MRITKIISYIIFLFLSIFTTYAVVNFYWEWTENDWAWWLNDSFTFSNNSLILYDNISNEYINENKRFYLWPNTLFNTNHYWDFKIKPWTDFIAYKLFIKNWQCTEGDVSYYFSWTLISEYWWELKTVNSSNNYYCPKSNKLSIELTSLVTWNMIISSDNEEKEIIITDSYWNENNVSVSNVFDNKKLSINGKFIWDNSNLEWELSNSLDNLKWVELEWTLNKLELMKNIDSNLFQIKKNIIPIDDNVLLSLSWEDNFIYNYENDSEVIPSHNENKWKTLRLWRSWIPLEVDWWKTIIIEWWNIFINTDIYNKDNDSLLVIVAKRDPNNLKNWWNIYINPNVTNIDAVIISYWSILNFNWTKVLTIENWDSLELRKQLLIYGSLYTKNTIWEDVSIFWTDHYMANWWNKTTTWIYNLENLRTFQTILSNGLDEDDLCYDYNNQVVAMWDNPTSSLQYAFAWKKECYIDNATSWNLRSTDSFAKTVIEYNPRVSNSDLRILQLNK